jgi:hypothetical protein
MHLLARVRQRVRRVDLPTPSITRRLRCIHRRRRPCNLVGRTWLPSASARQLRASWRLLCPTTRPWQLQSSRLWPTGRSWQLGASWLRPCSLMSPRGCCVSKLRPCELVLRLQTLQLVEGQVVVAGPGRSGLVVTKSADAGVVNRKK